MRSHRKEGVEGVAFMGLSRNLHIQTTILITFMLLKGLISTFKKENDCNKALMDVSA